MRTFIAEAVQVLSAARNLDSRSDHGHNRTAPAFRCALLALLALGLLGGISQAQEPLVIGPNGDVSIAKTLSVTGDVRVAKTLSVGAAAFGDKISLWGKPGGANYGFGIGNLKLQIYTDTPGAAIAFGYRDSKAFTETMRIVGTGEVGIGTTTPNANTRLNVAGGIIAKTLSVSGGASFTGSVGIGTASAPAATLDVAGDAKVTGDLKAASATVSGRLNVVGDVQAASVNGERPPIVLTLGAKNNTGNGKWSSLQVDIGPYCADDDGCTIRLLMQNLKDWEVKIAEELIMIRAVGAYSFFGHTRQFGGGEWNNWLLGHGDKKFRLFNDPSDWCRADNYPGDWAFERNGTALPKTNISITCKPNIDARIIIYDR